VNTGSIIGETNNAQMLIPNKVIAIWLRDPMETPNSAPVTK
jgi:hypothetical protein